MSDQGDNQASGPNPDQVKAWQEDFRRRAAEGATGNRCRRFLASAVGPLKPVLDVLAAVLVAAAPVLAFWYLLGKCGSPILAAVGVVAISLVALVLVGLSMGSPVGTGASVRPPRGQRSAGAEPVGQYLFAYSDHLEYWTSRRFERAPWADVLDMTESDGTVAIRLASQHVIRVARCDETAEAIAIVERLVADRRERDEALLARMERGLSQPEVGGSERGISLAHDEEPRA
ncbi:MAG: hypothetical protein HZB16_05800 [Armatimonadetes bacterium]|nr:hypothetical protein [Armatimonadota bacterium]